MDVDNSAAVDLSQESLTAIPHDVQKICGEIQELNISLNPGIRLNSAIGSFNNLRKLWLRRCALSYLPSEIGKLTKLEVLDLSWNDFKCGINSAIGHLRHLKNLNLNHCELPYLPYSIGQLEELEVLSLSHNSLKRGLCPSFGQLRHLKKLILTRCQLQNLPDSFGDLENLEVLDLSGNLFIYGLNQSFRRLSHLKNLNLSDCNLRNFPDMIGDLEALEVLDLSMNSFINGLDISVGRLRHLKNLNLRACKLQSLPDSFGNLKELIKLNLRGNWLTEYPSCILNLKNLKTLDLSFPAEKPQIGATQNRRAPGITALPVELADTNLQSLELDENPITEPPKAIWRQGLPAIKSYFREKSYGSDGVCPDTINMIGNVSAGKTSVAQSLVKGSPDPAAEDDRTRVMQQLRAGFGENGKLLVNINDFGGHPIYHAVIPIFLPTDGLAVLVYDMSLPEKDQESTVRQWFLTLVAKSKCLRVIVVGTRCDKISEKKRHHLENHMNRFTSSLLEEVKREVIHHINVIEHQKASGTDVKKLQHLRDLITGFKDADISVVSLSCVKPDHGLASLLEKISRKLRRATMPRRWFRVMNSIMQASSNRPYLTWDEVTKLYKEQVADAIDHTDLVIILRYLVSTSQIVWLEHHGTLKKFIFHAPQSIIKICKDVLDHDQTRQWAAQWGALYSKDVERYSKGLLDHPFLLALLSDKEIADIAIQFLQNFNLISEKTTDNGSRTYVIPSNLPVEEPLQILELQSQLDKCPNSVVIRLSFLGSVLPMSFFETSMSSMLTVARGLASKVSPAHLWRDGLIILYDAVCFALRRRNNILTFAAYSEHATSSPWVILQPIVKSLHEIVTASWHGATPDCLLLCPACRLHSKIKPKIGEIEMTLETLASDVQSTRARLMCRECVKTIPLCLCFPAERDSLTAAELEELKTFFAKLDTSVACGSLRLRAATNKRFSEDSTVREKITQPSLLVRRLRMATPRLVANLDRHSVFAIVDELMAAREGSGLITDDHRQDIQAMTTDKEKARKLLDIVCSIGDEAIRVLVDALNSDVVRRPDLAALILETGGPSNLTLARARD